MISVETSVLMLSSCHPPLNETQAPKLQHYISTQVRYKNQPLPNIIKSRSHCPVVNHWIDRKGDRCMLLRASCHSDRRVDVSDVLVQMKCGRALFVLPYVSVVAEKTAHLTEVLKPMGCKVKGYCGPTTGIPLAPRVSHLSDPIPEPNDDYVLQNDDGRLQSNPQRILLQHRSMVSFSDLTSFIAAGFPFLKCLLCTKLIPAFAPFVK